jgi:peptide deformylase
MTIRPIIGPDKPALRRKARAVDNPNTAAIQQLIDDLIATMREAPGVGLAAPQVAVSQRIAVVEYGQKPERARSGTPDEPVVGRAEPPERKLYVIVNPQIVARSEELVEGAEGCLSLPGYAGSVMRHEAVTVKALNRKGRPIKIKARGWLARIFQHEIDHLDGVLFIDRATKVWRLEDDEQEAASVMRE